MSEFFGKNPAEHEPQAPVVEKPTLSLEDFKDEADAYCIKILRENNFDDDRILMLMQDLHAGIAAENIKINNVDIMEQLAEQEKKLSSDDNQHETKEAKMKSGKLKKLFAVMTVLAGITAGSMMAVKNAEAGSSVNWERSAQRWADQFMRDATRMPGKMFDDSRRRDSMGINRDYQAQREVTMEIRRIYDSYRQKIQSDPGNAMFWEEKRDREVRDMLMLKGIINQNPNQQ